MGVAASNSRARVGWVAYIYRLWAWLTNGTLLAPLGGQLGKPLGPVLLSANVGRQRARVGHPLALTEAILQCREPATTTQRRLCHLRTLPLGYCIVKYVYVYLQYTIQIAFCQEQIAIVYGLNCKNFV